MLFGEENPHLLDNRMAFYDREYEVYDIFEKVYVQVQHETIHISDQKKFDLPEKAIVLTLETI